VRTTKTAVSRSTCRSLVPDANKFQNAAEFSAPALRTIGGTSGETGAAATSTTRCSASLPLPCSAGLYAANIALTRSRSGVASLSIARTSSGEIVIESALTVWLKEFDNEIWTELERASSRKKGLATSQAKESFKKFLGNLLVEKRNAPSLKAV
jgi:hypothetical protein